MSEKRDIKNLKELVDFGFAVEKAGADIFQGGFHADKLAEIFNIVPTVAPAFEGIGEIPSELSDLDESELADLIAHVASKGVLPAKAEMVLEKSIQVAFASWALYLAIKG